MLKNSPKLSPERCSVIDSGGRRGKYHLLLHGVYFAIALWALLTGYRPCHPEIVSQQSSPSWLLNGICWHFAQGAWVRDGWGQRKELRVRQTGTKTHANKPEPCCGTENLRERQRDKSFRFFVEVFVKNGPRNPFYILLHLHTNCCVVS